MAPVEHQTVGTAPAEVLRLLLTAEPAAPWGIPCAARPGSGLVHLDGPCGCFYGGQRPVFARRPGLR